MQISHVILKMALADGEMMLQIARNGYLIQAQQKVRELGLQTITLSVR